MEKLKKPINMRQESLCPPNLIATNVNSFDGDLFLSCTYSPDISPESFLMLSKDRKAYSFCPELHHLDKLGFKLCTIFRLDRVKSLIVLTKDGSPHSMQIPLMVQEAAEDVGFDKKNIRYFCIEKGELIEFSDLTVRKARHFSMIEHLLPYSRLEKVTEILRSDNGCPNDRKETFESVIDHLREEVEEISEALQKNDIENLEEEIGDVLYNLALMGQIGKEKGLFGLNDIANKVSQKMIDKHDFVFEGLSYKY